MKACILVGKQTHTHCLMRAVEKTVVVQHKRQSFVVCCLGFCLSVMELMGRGAAFGERVAEENKRDNLRKADAHSHRILTLTEKIKIQTLNNIIFKRDR